jgi:putative NADH-flavin reductase
MSSTQGKRVVIFGASGATGKCLVEAALAAGHQVAAFVRDPAKLGADAKVEVLRGDVSDAAAVAAAVKGRDAVFSVLGQAKGSAADVLTSASRNLVAGMTGASVRRLVVLFGAAANVEGDGERSLGHRMLLGALGVVAARLAHDVQGAADLVTASGLDWTIVRPMRLTDGPATQTVKTQLFKDLGMGDAISRRDLADLMVRQLGSTEFVCKAPMVWSA